MKVFTIHFLCCLASLLGCVQMMAQQYPFVYYTPRDGLVNGRVRSIKQDSKGRMYFITYAGLSVYDGVVFNNYRKEDGLAVSVVNDIIEISPDSFLIASNARELNTLVDGKIGNHITADNFYPVVNKFLKSKSGDFYFLTDDGLYRLIENRLTRLPMLDKQDKEIGHNLSNVTEWNQFLLFLPWSYAHKDKLIIYDTDKHKVVATITEKSITSTAVTSKGELWLSSIDGIESLDSSALMKGTILLNPVQVGEDDKKWNATLYVDYYGNTWVFGNNEVLYLSSSGEHQIFSGAQGLKTNNLSDIFLDREGNTWMASDGNGIIKMPGNNIQISGDLVPGVTNNFSAFCHHLDTTWLFNITNNSFYRIHNKQLTVFPVGIKPPFVGNIYIDGNALYYTTRYKVYRIVNKNLHASFMHPIETPLGEMSITEIGLGVIDPNGVIVQCIQRNDGICFLITVHDGQVQMSHQLTYALDQLTLYKNSHLWVATRDNLLRAYSLHPESLSQYMQLKYEYSKEIEGIEPRSIAVDTSGNAWIGTRYNGIYRLRIEDGVVQEAIQFTTLDGLTDNFVRYLYCDPDNNIWTGSWTGMDKISFKNGEYVIENVTKSKNLFLGISRILSVENDMIWVLTSTGDLIKISPTANNSITTTPSLFITRLAVNDSVYDDSMKTFPYNLNNFTIGVAAPSFIDEKSTRYSYWLQGSGNNNWSEPSNTALFNFINLSPGSYTLHLKAEFPAGMFSDQELKYAFTILPPFWRTWWFLSLLGLFVLGFMGLLARYYYNRKFETQRLILERKQAIEKERTRIATDMHDDLGAGLSRIKFLSDTIGLKKQRHLPIEDEIANIGHYAHEMIDKMGEIVWALNERNDSLSDLLSYTRAYSVEYLAENGLQGNIEKIPQLGNITVSGEFRRNIFLSVKEALHNVVKHAKANEVHIRFVMNDKLVISIQDDGIGFDQENSGLYGNGLININKRMSEIGGEVNIINDHGTCVVLTAPIPS